jgi:anti-sigma factor RsiW
MSLDRNNPAKPPTPEELLAFADGELPAAEADAMEAWLRAHPDAADTVQALRRPTGLCHEHAAPEPAPATWDRTFQGIEVRLAGSNPVPRAPGGSQALRAVLGLTAACLVGLLLTNAWRPSSPPPGPSPVVDDEPYPVATAAEIVILSMDPRNLGNLVVGGSPIAGDLDLADFHEVKMLDRKPNNDGQVPEMHQGGSVPMILPTNAWGGKGD